jgi:hypothetical protein
MGMVTPSWVRRRRPPVRDRDGAVGDRAAEPPFRLVNPELFGAGLEDIGDAIDFGVLLFLAAGRVDRQARGDAEPRHRQRGVRVEELGEGAQHGRDGRPGPQVCNAGGIWHRTSLPPGGGQAPHLLRLAFVWSRSVSGIAR